MAGIVDHLNQATTHVDDLMRLCSKPMFNDLQASLAPECMQATIPYTLVLESREETTSPDNLDNCKPSLPQSLANHIVTYVPDIDLVVEDATIQAEFRQLAPSQDKKVSELEKFYNTQSVSIVTQRTDAIGRVQTNRETSPENKQKDLSCIHAYYNELQVTLIKRVSRSIQLLKSSMPKDCIPTGMTSKKSVSRMLNAKAVAIMNVFYNDHYDHPYPSDEEKAAMAAEGGITVSQVKAWFANKRNRTLNTRPKRQKLKMQKEKHHISKSCMRMMGTDAKHRNLHLQDISNTVYQTRHSHNFPVSVL